MGRLTSMALLVSVAKSTDVRPALSPTTVSFARMDLYVSMDTVFPTASKTATTTSTALALPVPQATPSLLQARASVALLHAKRATLTAPVPLVFTPTAR